MANTTIYVKGPDFSGQIAAPAVTIDPIPNNISQAQGTTLDMSQYINDPGGVRTSTEVLTNGNPLPDPWFVSYDPVTELLSFDTAGQATGLTLRVTHPGDTVDSNVFEAAVTLNQWLGDGLTGEFGAIAVNDNWASTVYEYQRQFAPTIPTLPTPTTGAALPTSSGVNPNASDEYMVFDLTGFRAAMNNAAIRVVFIAKGTDLYTGFAQTETISISGTASVPRWFIYWDNDTNSTADPRPWALSQTDRVQGPFELDADGISYTYFVGLAFGIDGSRSQRSIWLFNGANNCTIYRCMQEYVGQTAAQNGGNGSGMVLAGSCGNSITFYESVLYKAYEYSNEFDHLTISGGDNHRVISCELGDPNNASLQWGPGWGGTGLVIEDCDIYKDRRYDGSGNLDVNGSYSQGDASVGGKSTAGNSGGPHIRFYGNRCWGQRPGDPVLDPTNTSGYQFGTSDLAAQYRIDCRYNVMLDAGRGAVAFQTGQGGGSNHSFVYNLIADGLSGYTQTTYSNYDNTEWYQNTVSNYPNDTYLMVLWTPAGNTVDNTDIMGNFFQDTGAWSNPRGANQTIGYNGYAGTYSIENVSYGNDYEAPSKAALNMGDFSFYRKKLTGPELVTVSGVVPTSSTPSAFSNGSPGVGDANQVGSRTGIGVDDSVIGDW